MPINLEEIKSYWLSGKQIDDAYAIRDIRILCSEIDRLTELVELTKALIKKEWIEDQEYGSFCPFCEGQKPVEITSKMDKKSRNIISEFNKTAGHSPSCIRQSAIALIGENK